MADSTNSILGTVSKLLGSEDEYFEPDLITHINSVFATLQQLGVGPEDGFSISDDTALWSDYTSDLKILNMGLHVEGYCTTKI